MTAISSAQHKGTAGMHARHHVRKGKFNPQCPLCVAAGSHAITGQAPDSPLSDNAVLATEVLQEIRSGATPHAGIHTDFDRDRAARLASRSYSLHQAALIFGLKPEEFESLVTKEFGLDWDSLSTQEAARLLSDVEGQVFEKARYGDGRFTILLIECGKLPGWVRGALPEKSVTPQAEDLSGISTEELAKRAGYDTRLSMLRAVCERQSRFSEVGVISPTLVVMDVTPEERQEFAKQSQAPSPTITLPRPFEVSPETIPEPTPEAPKVEVPKVTVPDIPGPVIYRPEAGAPLRL